MAKISSPTINMDSRVANWTLTDQNLLVSDVIPLCPETQLFLFFFFRVCAPNGVIVPGMSSRDCGKWG